jgi:hypothetical protein
MKILPENYRRLMSPEDRAKFDQHTIEEIRPKWEAKTERDLQKQIYSWLKLHDYFFVWSRMDKKTTGIIGTPDFCIAYKGYFVGVECKTEDGLLTREQAAAFKKIEAQGGLTYIVRSFEEFVAILKGPKPTKDNGR